MFSRRLPGLLHVQLDILHEVGAEVGVGADTDGKVVVALFAGSGKLQLNLLLVDQACEVVGRSYQGVSSSV